MHQSQEEMQAVAATTVTPTTAAAVAAPGGAILGARSTAAASDMRTLDKVAAPDHSDLGTLDGSTAAVVGRTSCPGSKVVTVIMPHDVSWTPAPQQQQPVTAAAADLASDVGA